MAVDLSNCPLVSFKTTAAEFRSWPEDGKRYELIDGDAYVSPSPSRRHQEFVLELARLLRNFLDEHPIARVFIAPLDVQLDDDNVFQPDVFVVLNAHAGRLLESHVLGAPDLVVEALSPGTSARDRNLKFRRYAAKDVPEVWLADPSAQTIEVYRRRADGALVLAETLGVDGTATTPLLPGLSIPVSRLFR